MKKDAFRPTLPSFQVIMEFFFHHLFNSCPLLPLTRWLVRDVTVMSQQWACAMGLGSQRVEIGRGTGQGSASKRYSVSTNREPPLAPGEGSQRDASIDRPPAV